MDKKYVNSIKNKYKEGMKIKLIQMAGEPTMPSGLKGEIKFVDDIGQIHVRWENGRGLALVPKEDKFITI